MSQKTNKNKIVPDFTLFWKYIKKKSKRLMLANNTDMCGAQ